MRHHVVRPADLEGEDRVQVFPLEPDLSVSSCSVYALRLGQLTSHPSLAERLTASVKGVSLSFSGAA
jgi:hypothetical protein